MMGLRRMWRAEGNFQSVLSTTRSWNQKQCPPWQQVLYLPYPYAISPLPSPVLLAFDFETGSDFFRLVLNLLGLGFWLSFPQYQRLWASFIRPMFTVLYFYSELLGGGSVKCQSAHMEVFLFCYSISFVEDCRCLVHHYSNSTIIKSEEGLRLLSTRMTGIHRYTRLLFLYHTFRIQTIQLSTEVESCL